MNLQSRSEKKSILFFPVLLFCIFFIAFFLRFYKLGQVPVGFHRDEAFLGYNAYSLFKTGKDMTGTVFPLHLQSFLYSPAGYAYLSIPFIAIFGLTEFAVRFPSALFGTLTVLLTYFFVRELFAYYVKWKEPQNYAEFIALTASFLLAISPWHVNLSRVATENVIVVFFITLGTWLYLLWVRKQTFWLLIVSFLLFGFTLFLYQAPRAFLPFYIPLLVYLFRPTQVKKHFIKVSALFVIVILVPIILILSSHNLSTRIRMLSIFQNPKTQLILDEQIREEGGGKSSILATRIFHNKIFNYSSTFLENYFSHFSYDFLFTDAGLPDRYRVPQMGLLYIFELPLLLLGIWTLFSEDKRIATFLSLWILLAPLGSGLTFDDVPNLQRTLIVFPALSIVSAVGLLYIWLKVGSLKFAKVVQSIIVIIIVYGVAYYLNQYYVHQIHHRPWYRQEGYKEMVSKVNTLLPQYKQAVITDSESAPAIFFLFYNTYNPTLIQKQLQQNSIENYGELSFANYQFSQQVCPLHETPTFNHATGKTEYPLSGQKNLLYINVGSCVILHNKVKTLAEIKRSDNTVVFKIQSLE